MRASLAVAVALAIGLSTAAVADGYRAPEPMRGYKDGPAVQSWAGFYIGVNSGYGWSDHNDKFAQPAFGILPNGINPQGAFGGGQIGYNWQGILHPNLVLGIEADIQASEIKDRDPGQLVGQGAKSNLDDFGTVRGRLGFAFGSSLLFGTGGLAFGGIRNETTENVLVLGPPVQPVVVPFQRNTSAATGYVIGGGWEYKISQAWSIKAEYLYMDLGRHDPLGVPFGFTAVENACTTAVSNPPIKCSDDAFQTVRVGVNYHLH